MTTVFIYNNTLVADRRCVKNVFQLTTESCKMGWYKKSCVVAVVGNESSTRRLKLIANAIDLAINSGTEKTTQCLMDTIGSDTVYFMCKSVDGVRCGMVTEKNGIFDAIDGGYLGSGTGSPMAEALCKAQAFEGEWDPTKIIPQVAGFDCNTSLAHDIVYASQLKD